MRTRFLLIWLVIACGSAIAGTVQQRFVNDASFKLYAVIFKISQAPNGAVTGVQLASVHDVRWEHEHPEVIKPVPVPLPKHYIAVATRKIYATRYSLFKHNGKPEDSYVGFYYAPRLGDRVIVNVSEPE